MSKQRLINGLLICFLILSFFSLLPGFSSEASAAPLPQTGNPVSRKVPLFGEDAPAQDIVLKGYSASREFEIAAPSYASLASGSFINLVISHSPLLIPDRSALTVYLDDKPLDSIRLDATNKTGFTWKLNLPAQQKPAQGRYRIRVEALMRTNEANCAAIDDSGAWTNLLPESSVTLQFEPVTGNPDLANLTDYLFASKSLIDRQFTLVLPQNPTDKDLARASMVLARLGSMAGYSGLNINLSFGEPKTAYANRIYLGGPAIFPLLTGLNLKLPAGTGGFSGTDNQSGVVQISWNGKNTGLNLVLSGNSEEAVDRAAGAIFDNRGLALLKGEYSLIRPGSEYKYSAENAQTSLNPTPENGQNFLGNLGFSNQTVKGFGQQESRFNYFIPGNLIATGEAVLGIDYSYSSLVDQKKSSLTILVNDVALQAVALPARLVNSTDLKPSRLNVTIPRNILRSGDNAVRFAWNLQPDSNATYCASNEVMDLWGTIFSTSDLNLKLGENNSFSSELKDLPYPFSGSKDGTLVVIPEKATNAEMRTAVQILAELGRSQPSGRLDMVNVAVDSRVTTEQLAKNHVVLVGTPADNRWLAQANNSLPVKWDSEQARTLLTKWDLKMSVNDLGEAGFLQVLPSIWSNGQSKLGLMVALLPASSGDNGLEQYINAIARRLYIGKYSGNVMIVDSTGKVVLVNTAKETPLLNPTNVPARTAPAAPPTLAIVDNQAVTGQAPKTNTLSRDNALIFLGAAGVILVLIILFILFVRQARRASGGGTE